MDAPRDSTFNIPRSERAKAIGLAERRALGSARVIVLALMTPCARFPASAALEGAWRDMLALDRLKSRRDDARATPIG